MSKVLAILLCLIIISSGMPQINKASAAGLALCSSAGVEIPTKVEYTIENSDKRYPVPGGIIPKEANFIYFRLSGKLEQGRSYVAYINLEGRWGQHNDGYSSQDTFNNDGNTIELSVDKSKSPNLFLLTPDTMAYYRAYLLVAPFDPGAPKCYIVDYKVGPPGNSNQQCSIVVSPSDVGPGQSVAASVSSALPGEYNISYSRLSNIDSANRDNSPKKVLIDKDGNGTFVFKAGQSFLNEALVSVSTIVDQTTFVCSAKFNITNKPVSNDPTCSITPLQDQNLYTVLEKPQVIATNMPPNVTYWARIIYKNRGESQDLPDQKKTIEPSRAVAFKLSPTGYLDEGKYVAEVRHSDQGDPDCFTSDFTIGEPDLSFLSGPDCGAKVRDDKGKEIVITCTETGATSCGGTSPAIQTAIGCIHTNPAELVKDLMTFIIGISGGLAFLLMILGAFQMLTSAGNPETLHAGRERLTSAIIGLLIVIFATLLLQIIGFDILKIPGFER